MNKIIIFGIVGVILFGFLLGFLPYTSYVKCTQIKCDCVGNAEAIQCNSCSLWDPVFTIFLIDYGEACSAKETIYCVDNQQVESKYEADEASCKHKVKLFFQ